MSGTHFGRRAGNALTGRQDAYGSAAIYSGGSTTTSQDTRMQLRPVSSSYHRLPQRPEPVVSVPTPGRQAGTGMLSEPARMLTIGEPDSARRQYHYSRIDAVAGRTANALRNYTEIAEHADREQLQAQLGLDIYV